MDKKFGIRHWCGEDTKESGKKEDPVNNQISLRSLMNELLTYFLVCSVFSALNLRTSQIISYSMSTVAMASNIDSKARLPHREIEPTLLPALIKIKQPYHNNIMIANCNGPYLIFENPDVKFSQSGNKTYKLQ